jgi:hypothetical protein
LRSARAPPQRIRACVSSNIVRTHAPEKFQGLFFFESPGAIANRSAKLENIFNAIISLLSARRHGNILRTNTVKLFRRDKTKSKFPRKSVSSW